MKKWFPSLTLLFLVSAPSLLFADSLSLTTYYPAPFGAYSLLKLTPNSDASMGVCDATKNGQIYLSSDSNQLKICIGGSWGTTSPWTLNAAGKIVYLTNSDADTAYKTGIGVLAPNARLHVKGIDDATYGQVKIETTGSNAKLSFVNSSGAVATGTGSIAMSNLADNEGLHFLINNVDKMILDENGNVGIGITAPTARLDIARAVSVNPYPPLTIAKFDNLAFIDQDTPNGTVNSVCVGTDCTLSNQNFMGLRMYLGTAFDHNMTLGVPWVAGGASSISINVGGIQQLVATRTAVVTDPTVNVGIGVVTPNYKLQVNGPIGGALDSAHPASVGELQVDCQTIAGKCYATYAP